jgi:hypothetical protein
MASVHVEARKRCYNHPHRETDLVCGRCRTGYCADCLGEPSPDGVLLCENCAREVVAAEAAKLTFKERLVLNLRSLGRTSLVALVLIVILGGLFFAMKDKFEQPLTPEEMARFRYAMTGSFQTEEGANLNSTVVGAQVVGVTSAADGHPAKQVINEFTGESIPAWRSTDASFPQEITVDFSQRGAPEKITLQNNPNEPMDTYPKEIEVLLSVDGPDSGFVSVGRFIAQPTTELQRFTFPRTVARWVTLRVLSNYGSSAYTSLDEFGAYNVPPESPFSAPRLTPTAAP